MFMKPPNLNFTTSRALLFPYKRTLSGGTRLSYLQPINIKENLGDKLREKISLLNNQYESLVGIAEVRKVQNKVLEKENEFVSKTRRRISCQDELDRLKENIKSLREKLETLPRSSDSYLNLLTTEHQLLRDQISVEAQLSKLKEEEQLSFSAFSNSLRQSHQVERLNQDKAKYRQMFIAVLTLLGYPLTYIYSNFKNERKQVGLINEKCDIIGEKVDKMPEEMLGVLPGVLCKVMPEVMRKVVREELRNSESIKNLKQKPVGEEKQASSGWISYIPGLTTLINWWYPIRN